MMSFVRLAALAIALSIQQLRPEHVHSFPLRYLLLVYWLRVAWRVGATIARAVDPQLTDSGVRLRSAFYALSYLILTMAAAGWLHSIHVVFLTLVHVLVDVALDRAPTVPDRRFGPGELIEMARRRPRTTAIVLAFGALALANVAWALLSPFNHIDDFSYHLVFPVDWMQSQSLVDRLIPFGNHAASYQPKNIELLFTSILLTMGQFEALALVQLGFLVASSIAVYDLLRLAGLPHRASLIGCLPILATPVAAQFLDSGYTDFAYAFLTLMAIDTIVSLRLRPSTALWVEFWVVLGVFMGTKSFAIVMTLLLLLPLAIVLLAQKGRLVVGIGGRGIALGAGITLGAWLLAGGWWYVRNMLATGNPIFPMEVNLFGFEMFDGAYRSEVFRKAPLHRLQRLLPLPMWIPFCVGLATLCVQVLRGGVDSDHSQPGARWLGLILPAIPVLLFALILPVAFAPFAITEVPRYTRYVIVIVPLSGMIFAAPIAAGGRLARGFEWLLLASLLAAVLWPASRRSILLASGARTLEATEFVIVSACFAMAAIGLAALLCFVRPQRPRLVQATALIAVGLSLGIAKRTSDPRSAHVDPAIRGGQWFGTAFDDPDAAERVAVTGTNLTLPFMGYDLANQVRYVNINASKDAVFHEHFLERRVPGRQPGAGRSGTEFYRAEPDRRAWLDNMETFAPDLVVIMKLPPWMKGDPHVGKQSGFPLEYRWAEEMPLRFEKVRDRANVKVYEFVPLADVDDAGQAVSS